MRARWAVREPPLHFCIPCLPLLYAGGKPGGGSAGRLDSGICAG